MNLFYENLHNEIFIKNNGSVTKEMNFLHTTQYAISLPHFLRGRNEALLC